MLGVLVICALITALAVALSRSTHEDVSDTRMSLALIEAQLHVDNALVRVIAALGDPDDTLHSSLNAPEAVIVLKLDRESVQVRVEAESGKLDLNHAPLPLLRAAFEALIPQPGRATAILGAIAEARRKDAPITDIRRLLSPAEQVGDLPGVLASYTTTLTGAHAPVMTLAPPRLRAVIERMGGSSAGGAARPIYTVRAQLVEGGLPPLARRVTIAFAQLPATRPEHLWLVHWGRDH